MSIKRLAARAVFWLLIAGTVLAFLAGDKFEDWRQRRRERKGLQ